MADRPIPLRLAYARCFAQCGLVVRTSGKAALVVLLSVAGARDVKAESPGASSPASTARSDASPRSDAAGMDIALEIESHFSVEEAGKQAADAARVGLSELLERRGFVLRNDASRTLHVSLREAQGGVGLGYVADGVLPIPDGEPLTVQVECECAAKEFVELLADTVDQRLPKFIREHRRAIEVAAVEPAPPTPTAALKLEPQRWRYRPKSDIGAAGVINLSVGAAAGIVGGTLLGVALHRDDSFDAWNDIAIAGLSITATAGALVVLGGAMLAADAGRERRAHKRRLVARPTIGRGVGLTIGGRF